MLLLNFWALLGQAKGKLFQPLQTNIRTRQGQLETQDSVGPFYWPKWDRTAPLAPAGQQPHSPARGLLSLSHSGRQTVSAWQHSRSCQKASRVYSYETLFSVNINIQFLRCSKLWSRIMIWYLFVFLYFFHNENCTNKALRKTIWIIFCFVETPNIAYIEEEQVF